MATRAPLSVLLAWLERLDADVTLSHHRSLALALESLGDPTAAGPLARLLAKPGMSGHAMTRLEPLHNRDADKRRRTAPLREIVLARACTAAVTSRTWGGRFWSSIATTCVACSRGMPLPCWTREISAGRCVASVH